MSGHRNIKLTFPQPFRVSYWPPKSAAGGKPDTELVLRDFQVDPGRLRGFCVLLLGLGAVNGIVFRILAQMGIGTIIVCDMDQYDATSHSSQPVEPGHEGESKVVVQAEVARRLNPNICIVAFQGFAQDLPLCVVRAADVIVLAGDNLELVVHAADLAIRLGKPLIEAAVAGESVTAHLRRYDLRDPSSVCPACGMNEQEWRNLKSRVGCSSGEAPVPGRQPTRTSPALCGVAAHMAACEVAKEIAGDRPLPAGDDVTYCLASQQLYRSKLPRNGRCRLSHQAWRIIDMSKSPAQITLREVIDRFTNGGRVQCKAEIPWVSDARCPSRRCGDVVPVHRFARWGAVVGACGCGERLVASAMGQRSVIPAADLELCLDRTLAELGLAPWDSLAVSTGESWTCCFLGGASLSDWLKKWEERND